MKNDKIRELLTEICELTIIRDELEVEYKNFQKDLIRGKLDNNSENVQKLDNMSKDFYISEKSVDDKLSEYN